MTTKEVANRFHTLAQQGKWNDIQDELFSADARSIEPEHAAALSTVKGLDKIKEKGKLWESMIAEFHGGYCLEPQVGGNFFTCAMGVDFTMKDGTRRSIDEVAVYEVQNGKITTEQFFYS